MAMARRGTFSVSLAKRNIYTCSALFSGPNAPSSVAIDYSSGEAMKTAHKNIVSLAFSIFCFFH